MEKSYKIDEAQSCYYPADMEVEEDVYAEEEEIVIDEPNSEYGAIGKPCKLHSPKEDSNANQWSMVHGDCIIAVSNTFDTLEPGYYSICHSNEIGMYFSKNKIETNKLYRLPNSATDIVLDDISKFWTLEDTYKKYNRVFRRNYLLYSAPGTGKTSLINLMCQELIEKYKGIVFSLGSGSEIEMYVDAIKRVRKLEPNRKIITIIEDIDNFISTEGGRSSLDTYLLNILDGNYKLGGVVTIATTNFIEKIESRYKNRPSRFDRVIEFPLPNEESRKLFIEKTVLPEDLKKINIDEWVEKTKGFTIDHINELILLFFVFGHSEEESFKSITDMVHKNDKLENKTSINKSAIGFGAFTPVASKYANKHNDYDKDIDY